MSQATTQPKFKVEAVGRYYVVKHYEITAATEDAALEQARELFADEVILHEEFHHEDTEVIIDEATP